MWLMSGRIYAEVQMRIISLLRSGEQVNRERGLSLFTIRKTLRREGDRDRHKS